MIANEVIDPPKSEPQKPQGVLEPRMMSGDGGRKGRRRKNKRSAMVRASLMIGNSQTPKKESSFVDTTPNHLLPPAAATLSAPTQKTNMDEATGNFFLLAA